MSSALHLRASNLAALAARVRTPRYDRAPLQPHAVHIGVGGFHRAHQAVYLDDLLHLADQPRWGECGVGILPADARMREALVPQDCLYTLVEKSAKAEQVRIIGSMTSYLHAPAEPERTLARLADPATRIVSLTITEGGYFIAEGTHAFQSEHPEIQRDLAKPAAPATSIGYIVAALERRRRDGLPPFTVMSCDNLQGNGDVLRGVVLGFAGLRDDSLAEWIAHNVAFPNSMVDRITPGTTAEDREALARDYGVDDAWPVRTEPFRQWVIEDHFSNGRPAWQDVGAEIVTDVAPYELMKMRLLNASHMAMAYLGALAGYPYVHQVMQDPLFIEFITQFMEEVTPVVPKIDGVSIPDYKRELLVRFANPAIHDQVTRLCSEGSAKLPKWVLPSITELLQMHAPVPLLSLVIASWIHYLQRGVDEQGRPLEIIDACAVELRDRAQAAGSDPRPVLAIRSIFGTALPADSAFVTQVEQAMQQLAVEGAAQTIRRYLAR